jgi:hypothetical protein
MLLHKCVCRRHGALARIASAVTGHGVSVVPHARHAHPRSQFRNGDIPFEVGSILGEFSLVWIAPFGVSITSDISELLPSDMGVALSPVLT